MGNGVYRVQHRAEIEEWFIGELVSAGEERVGEAELDRIPLTWEKSCPSLSNDTTTDWLYGKWEYDGGGV
ncbi:hypothetical protein GCM10008025_06450 [Ornithinibacillus halotolerans]|uniref:Uncharacterized protein n=1 Tax=Ornithinibacillus halotolerans TaxID=1274357 RepID=A0A916RRB4_9BACI|nr:hypothetical protein GCM10008025_06450 [Ornithinibacillus halotolerans]